MDLERGLLVASTSSRFLDKRKLYLARIWEGRNLVPAFPGGLGLQAYPLCLPEWVSSADGLSATS